MDTFGTDKNTQILQQCLHCGNKGLLNVVSDYIHNYRDEEYDNYGNFCGVSFSATTKWFLLQCPVCENISLYKEYLDDTYYENSWDKDIIYPATKLFLTNVPKNIVSAFESALKIKNIDPAICILSLRRVLEFICIDCGAKGRTLDDKISDLIQNNALPKGLDGACWIIRQLGNKAAHSDEPMHFSNEVNQLFDFLETIINYLYVLPPKIDHLKSEIERKYKNHAELSKEDINE